LFLIIGAIFVVPFFHIKDKYDFFINSPRDENSSKWIQFKIEKGQSAKNIAFALEEKKIIHDDSAYFFYYFMRKNDAKNIKAGNYIISPNQDFSQIMEIIKKGNAIDRTKITILEGWRIYEIDKYLFEKGLIAENEFIDTLKNKKNNFDFDFVNFDSVDNLEGFLYPDTYFVNKKTFSSEKFAKRMIAEFEKKITQEFENEIKKNKRNIYDVMIIASLIEKEEKNKLEKAKVAGILWKRLDLGMRLGVDASLLYESEIKKNEITKEDIAKNSSYNTRKYLGLPPTPICSFHASSLKASVYPEKSKYLYYLHDKNGKIHYAVDNDGHNANKRKYLQ